MCACHAAATACARPVYQPSARHAVTSPDPVAAFARLPTPSQPFAPPCVQAWGLLELQRGNALAAVMLLDRCAALDPTRCSPVLRWTQVSSARKTVGSRRARVVAAATGVTAAPAAQ